MNSKDCLCNICCLGDISHLLKAAATAWVSSFQHEKQLMPEKQLILQNSKENLFEKTFVNVSLIINPK